MLLLDSLLFLIYGKDLASLSTLDRPQLVLYADDLLFQPISNLSDYYSLRDNIAAIENWSSGNSLLFNASKCKCMIISRR